MDRLERINVFPGEYFAADKEMMISTLLGSCVAACLFDPVNRIMGMNHFLLSKETYRQGGENFFTLSGRYGVQAMELLLNKMYQLGAERKHLKAKAFGGATLTGLFNGQKFEHSIGEVNLRFVRAFLDAEKIPLIAEDLGGVRGRTIYFVSLDHSVYVRKHHVGSLAALLQNEKQLSEKLEQEQKQPDVNISLWE
mgnify:FL=1